MNMQNKILSIVVILLITRTLQLSAQYSKQDSTFKKCYVGSTFFILGNFAKSNKPDFAQLNLGYRFTGKDVASIEFKTWKYAWPLGIPYGEFYEAPGENFPGYIRERGFCSGLPAIFMERNVCRSSCNERVAIFRK